MDSEENDKVKMKISSPRSIERITLSNSKTGPEKASESKTSEFLNAAQNGDLPTVSNLLQQNKDLLVCESSLGFTGLHYSAMRGHNDIVETLLENGVDVNMTGTVEGVVSKISNTALVFAAYYGHESTVKLLIDSGANMSHQNKRGNSALHDAAMMGHREVVRILLDNGIDVNLKNDIKRTAIILAATRGHTNVVEELIEAGADLTCQDISKNTVLHSSVMQGHDDIVKKLLQKNIDVNIRGYDNKTAFEMALLNGNLTAAKLLYDAKADIQSTLQYVLGKNLVKEREHMLEMLMSDERNENGRFINEDNSKYRVTRKLKSMIPSSIGLRDCIASLNEKFKWSSSKLWSIMMWTFFTRVILGTTFYFLDVYTDLNFSLYLLNQTKTNFSYQIDMCRPNFESKFNETVEKCRGANFDSNECLILLRRVNFLGDNCFNQEQRFEEPENWKIAGIVSLSHCILPILVTIITWVFTTDWKTCNLKTFLKIPLPFVTKIYEFHYMKELFKIFTKSRQTPMGRENFEDDWKKWNEKIRKQEAFVNLSLLIEASMESSFQFWFQTVFLFPTIFISFVSTEGGLSTLSDLFNVRLLSICFSFGSFAFTFYKIR